MASQAGGTAAAVLTEANAALAERSKLVSTALAQPRLVTEADFEAAAEELKALKHAFIASRTKQAFAASLASREPFVDLDRARLSADAALAECKAGVRAAKDDVQAARADVGAMCERVAALHTLLEERQRALAADTEALQRIASLGPAPAPLVVEVAGTARTVLTSDAARAIIAAEEQEAAECVQAALTLEASATVAASVAADAEHDVDELRRRLAAAKAERVARAALRATEAQQAQDAVRFYGQMTQLVNELTGN